MDGLFDAPDLLIFGVSDLHMGRRSFGLPRRSAFRGLTRHIIQTQQHLGHPALVLILGDFIDYYARSPEYGAPTSLDMRNRRQIHSPTVQGARQMTSEILIGDRKHGALSVFENTAALLRNGVQVRMMPGNHDPLLGHPQVFGLIGDHIGADLKTFGLLQGPTILPGPLLALHGHELSDRLNTRSAACCPFDPETGVARPSGGAVMSSELTGPVHAALTRGPFVGAAAVGMRVLALLNEVFQRPTDASTPTESVRQAHLSVLKTQVTGVVTAYLNTHGNGDRHLLTRDNIIGLINSCYTSKTAMDQGLRLRTAPRVLAEWAALGLQHAIGPSQHSAYYRTLVHLGRDLGTPLVWFGHTHRPLARRYVQPNGNGRRHRGGFGSRTAHNMNLLLMNGGSWNSNGFRSTPYLQARIHKGQLESTSLRHWTAGGPVTVVEYQRETNQQAWHRQQRSRRHSFAIH
jgi:UDP-2,3-diacylglucosamine pyrophosphatase LpxH